jgi:hypothetical protein
MQDPGRAGRILLLSIWPPDRAEQGERRVEFTIVNAPPSEGALAAVRDNDMTVRTLLL